MGKAEIKKDKTKKEVELKDRIDSSENESLVEPAVIDDELDAMEEKPESDEETAVLDEVTEESGESDMTDEEDVADEMEDTGSDGPDKVNIDAKTQTELPEITVKATEIKEPAAEIKETAKKKNVNLGRGFNFSWNGIIYN